MGLLAVADSSGSCIVRFSSSQHNETDARHPSIGALDFPPFALAHLRKPATAGRRLVQSSRLERVRVVCFQRVAACSNSTCSRLEMGGSGAKFMEATGTAGNLSLLAPKGTAEPAVMVATRWNLRVESRGPEFLWACAGGAAEFAAKVAAGEASAAFEDRGAKRSNGEPLVVCGARAFRSGGTDPNLPRLAPVGSVDCAEKVADDGKPSVVGGTTPSLSGLTPKGTAECAVKESADDGPCFRCLIVVQFLRHAGIIAIGRKEVNAQDFKEKGDGESRFGDPKERTRWSRPGNSD
jgi:hypothetical protein